MATVTERPRLESHVTALFERLRARIRRYVALEGLALCVMTLCVAFWLCLGVDWLFEPAAWVRRGMLVLGAIATAAVFSQMVVRRLAVPLPDSRLALLLERRFRSFDDSLLTSVDMTQSDRELGYLEREMLDNTLDEAGRQAERVQLDDIFRPEPMRRAISGAGLSVATLVVALLTVPGTLLFGVERLTGMTNDPWPRRVRLVVPGFEDGVKVVARGDDVDVLVQADLSMPTVPDVVQIRYVTDEGVRGRETMTRTGNAVANQDEFQDFRHSFNNVLTSLTFEVSGGDARVRDLQIQVVDSPTIGEAVLVCEYPAYMNRSPRELRVTGAMQVPLGTKVTLRAKSNKDLRRAEMSSAAEGSDHHTAVVNLPQHASDLRTFQFQLPDLASDTTLSFTLFDTDGIHNRRPFVVSLSAVADEPPQLSLQLQGIGSAITPSARLPMTGQIVDDYGVASASFQVTVDEKETVRAPFAAAPSGRSEFDVDEAFEVRDLKLKPGQKVHFGAEAQDAYHLADGDQPHTATSERFQLDVVTPETLRTMMESRELNLRQRFETIISEMTETRDSLAEPPETAQDEATPENPDQVASAKPTTTAAPSTDRKPAVDLRVERAKQNCEKNAQETLGVATGFDEILEELVNNRVDTEELRVRLKNRIAEPLRGIGEQMFPECDRRLQSLMTTPADVTARQGAIEQADAILVAMEQVRDQMLELESFNEAIDMLRSIISSEKSLQEQVRERQKRKVRDLLEDSE